MEMKIMSGKEFEAKADEILKAIEIVAKKHGYEFVKELSDGKGGCEGIRFMDHKTKKIVHFDVYEVLRLAELSNKYGEN